MSTVWQTEIALCSEYVDYLGHVTAAAHVTLFEEAHGQWLAEVMDDPQPAFVLVRLELDYRRELMFANGPVTVAVQPVDLTRSTVTVEEVMSSACGAHTLARAILVRWDRTSRRSMPFAGHELARIRTQLIERVDVKA